MGGSSILYSFVMLGSWRFYFRTRLFADSPVTFSLLSPLPSPRATAARFCLYTAIPIEL